jgi:glycosyltransferase involved in cell wall biosynthesis
MPKAIMTSSPDKKPTDMGNLLLFNLATDVDDPLLGFTTQWINRLAAHFDQIDVITMRAGRVRVAPNVNVYSVGKERGYSEARRGVVFYGVLARLLATRRYEACFAHMMPLFAAMGAPLLKLRGVPITLWYTHRQVSRVLQWAERVSYRVVTAAPDSFPIPTDKLRVLGHGINTDYFHPHPAQVTPIDPLATDTRPRLSRTQEMVVVKGGYIIQVARLMPIKHQETLMRAIQSLEEARIVLVGGSPSDVDDGYEHRLRNLAQGLDLGARVVFAGAQPNELVREYYRRALVAVNLSPPGLFDKAALESMASGLPTIVANPAFAPLLGDQLELLCLDSPEDVDGLRTRLERLLALSPAERETIGMAQRERVVAAHSLDGLITRLTNVLKTGEP